MAHMSLAMGAMKDGSTPDEGMDPGYYKSAFMDAYLEEMKYYKEGDYVAAGRARKAGIRICVSEYYHEMENRDDAGSHNPGRHQSGY